MDCLVCLKNMLQTCGNYGYTLYDSDSGPFQIHSQSSLGNLVVLEGQMNGT